MQTMKAQLEDDLGGIVNEDAAILQWLVRWAGMNLCRYAVGEDGRQHSI